MSNIQIKAVGDAEMKAFVKFPFELYKNNKQWVPPLIKQEIKMFDIYKSGKAGRISAAYFLAYKDGHIVGRVAAFINWKEVETTDKKRVRFGWLDFFEDAEVCKALLDRVMAFGKENGMAYIEGPMGVSNLDRAGLLVKGFEALGKTSNYYNYEYYPRIIEALGYEVGEEWIEYLVTVPEIEDAKKLAETSALLAERYHLKIPVLKSKAQAVSYLHQMVALINESFVSLPTFTPITKEQANYYKKKFAPLTHPDFTSFIFDKDDKMIAFGITMPNLSTEFQRMKGRLSLRAMWRIKQSFKTCKTADLLFIAVHPDYQKKGLTGILFSQIIKNGLTKRGIKYVETGPGLKGNLHFHSLWRRYDNEVIRERRTYKKTLADEMSGTADLA